jgi:hypothetical protein
VRTYRDWENRTHLSGTGYHERSLGSAGTDAGRIMTRESIAFPMRGDGDTANLVYFCSSPARERDVLGPEADQLQVMNVLRRTYIDIGAGLPDFHD